MLEPDRGFVPGQRLRRRRIARKIPNSAALTTSVKVWRLVMMFVLLPPTAPDMLPIISAAHNYAVPTPRTACIFRCNRLSSAQPSRKHAFRIRTASDQHPVTDLMPSGCDRGGKGGREEVASGRSASRWHPLLHCNERSEGCPPRG